MKAPSTDLMIKLALGGALVLGAVYVLKRAGGAVGEAVTSAVQAVNPLNNENVIYHTVNRATGGDDSIPLGVRIYDFFHPNE